MIKKAKKIACYKIDQKVFQQAQTKTVNHSKLLVNTFTNCEIWLIPFWGRDGDRIDPGKKGKICQAALFEKEEYKCFISNDVYFNL